ncbi:MAG: hypothetical protein IKG85_04540 [Clostridia bacterium]|nr:hypothetical protein [Clostridia bacterium]
MRKVLIVLLALVASASAACSRGSGSAEPPPAEAAEADTALLAEISPNAEVVRRTFCKKCGHIYEYASAEGVVGLTEDELKARFPEWEIEEFTREYVLMTRSIDGFCPEHHVIFLEGDKLVVYSIVEPELKLEKLLDFDSSPYELGPAEKLLLKKGVAFSSLKELDDYTDRYRKKQP